MKPSTVCGLSIRLLKVLYAHVPIVNERFINDFCFYNIKISERKIEKSIVINLGKIKCKINYN